MLWVVCSWHHKTLCSRLAVLAQGWFAVAKVFRALLSQVKRALSDYYSGPHMVIKVTGQLQAMVIVTTNIIKICYYDPFLEEL